MSPNKENVTMSEKVQNLKRSIARVQSQKIVAKLVQKKLREELAFVTERKKSRQGEPEKMKAQRELEPTSSTNYE